MRRSYLSLASLVFLLSIPVLGQARAAQPTQTGRPSTPNGLLLGMHWDQGSEIEPSGVASDRTFWIFQNGDAIELREIPDLLVPRSTGFWRAGSGEVHQDTNLHERYIWAAPLGQRPAAFKLNPEWKDFEPGSVHNMHVERELLFVGSDLISVRLSEGGCGGSCGESQGYEVFHLPASNLPNYASPEKPSLEISAVLGPAGMTAFNRAKAKLEKQAWKSEDMDCGVPSFDTKQWAILRQHGHWQARSNVHLWNSVCEGFFGTEFDIRTPVPEKLTGYDELAVGWDAVIKEFPNAQDAFEAPNRDFFVVLTSTELIVSRLQKGRAGAAVLREKLRDQEYAVMSQWAVGANVARWDHQVQSSSTQIPKSPTSH